jgi:type II restriction enzyme
MANKTDLREQRKGIVVNSKSKHQEKKLSRAMNTVRDRLTREFNGIQLQHESQWRLKHVVEKLSKRFPDVDFKYFFETSTMRPDGGILSMVSKKGDVFPILISEKKNQGTNDLRALEGKESQAKGNAIERLGKNVIGFRAVMKSEGIFPFVCFGDGCDFADQSSILDRVVTIAQFGHLNKIYLHPQGDGAFDRGAFFFRVAEWTENEMADVCVEIARKSVYYYFSKHGRELFLDGTLI